MTDDEIDREATEIRAAVRKAVMGHSGRKRRTKTSNQDSNDQKEFEVRWGREVNNAARVVITRGAGSRYYWTLTAYGEIHDCRRSEASVIKAAEAAENTLMQADLSRHYGKQRAG